MDLKEMKEDIDLLDSKITRLKIEYEQYFMRVLKREPLILRGEIEKTIMLYSGRSINNTSLKFRYNSLVSKYGAYKQYWGRSLKTLEEGGSLKKAEGSHEDEAAPPAPQKPQRAEAGAAGKIAEAVKDERIAELYARYIEARKECNEPTDNITIESLGRTVEQYKKKVEEQFKTTNVDFDVQIKDGKTKLVIRPKK